MNPQRKWRCEECGERHRNEDRAYDCCRPSVSELWICTECDKDHESEEEALFCCAACDEDLVNPEKDFMENQQELEQAGQQRLFGEK